MIPWLIGTFLLLVGTIDNLKYIWQAKKVKKYSTSILISRKFVIVSFLSHLIGTIYVLPKGDFILDAVYGVGVLTTGYLLWVSYNLYPKRAKTRPWNPWLFVMDSFDLLTKEKKAQHGFYSDRRLKRMVEVDD